MSKLRDALIEIRENLSQRCGMIVTIHLEDVELGILIRSLELTEKPLSEPLQDTPNIPLVRVAGDGCFNKDQRVYLDMNYARIKLGDTLPDQRKQTL